MTLWLNKRVLSLSSIISLVDDNYADLDNRAHGVQL